MQDKKLQSKLGNKMQNLIKTLVENARVFGVHIYFVGGIVRDLLLNLPIKDADIVVEGNAIDFCRKLEKKNIGRIKSIHKDFGTVKILIDNKEYDFASTRQEEYPESGCLPVVKNIGCPLFDDVSRRDFTINAIAINLETFEIVDLLGGQKDLENKILKTTYDKSFIDDPTRILRALGFSLRFNVRMDAHTKKLAQKYLKNPQREALSISRVDLTLKKLFMHCDPKALYEHILEEKLYKIWTDEKPEFSAQEIEDAINTLGTDDTAYLGALKKYYIPTCAANNDLETYNFFKSLTNSEITLYFAKCKDMRALMYKRKFENVKISTTGQDLLRLGFSEGPLIGQILEALLEQSLINQMTKEQEIDWVLKNFTIIK